jgi:hypothetical protein
VVPSVVVVVVALVLVLVVVAVSTDIVVDPLVPESVAEVVGTPVVIPWVADAVPASESVCEALPVGTLVDAVVVVVTGAVIVPAVPLASSFSRPLSPQAPASSSAPSPKPIRDLVILYPPTFGHPNTIAAATADIAGYVTAP